MDSTNAVALSQARVHRRDLAALGAGLAAGGAAGYVWAASTPRAGPAPASAPGPSSAKSSSSCAPGIPTSPSSCCRTTCATPASCRPEWPGAGMRPNSPDASCGAASTRCRWWRAPATFLCGLFHHDRADDRHHLDDGAMFDPATGRVTVQGGALNGGVYNVLRAHNVAITHGRCPSVGAAGFLLGGGIGFNMRQNGLGCDQLKASAVVKADGTAATLKRATTCSGRARAAAAAISALARRSPCRPSRSPRSSPCSASPGARRRSASRPSWSRRWSRRPSRSARASRSAR